MAKFTNYARGPRGIALKDGSTVWLDPGQSATIDKADIVEPLPDLGKKADAVEAADTGEIDALKTQVADLTKQVETLEADKAELAKVGAALAKEKADLTKQVETLSKKS